MCTVHVGRTHAAYLRDVSYEAEEEAVPLLEHLVASLQPGDVDSSQVQTVRHTARGGWVRDGEGE